MKRTLLAGILLVTVSGCSFSVSSEAAERWVSSCSKNPDFCEQKIVAMTETEKKLLADSEAAANNAAKAALELDKKRDAVADRIVAAHKMDRFPAIVQHRFDFSGGTCTGKITFNRDGFIVYTPSSDIRSCGDYKETK